jgi:Uma2 family endonuclease
MSSVPASFSSIAAIPSPTTVAVASPTETLADFVARLGDIPLSRIRFQPSPGAATLADAVRINEEGHLCELVDGALVEKPMGLRESVIAGRLVRRLEEFVESHDLGVVTTPDGMMQLRPNLMREPDAAFLPWDQFPGRVVSREAAPLVCPSLAVEVLSPSNTDREMERKRGEYFAAGTRLVWIIDPDERNVTVYRSPTDHRVLAESDTLDGEDVLPGFTLAIRVLFAALA